MTIVAFVRNIQYFGIAVLIQTGLSDLHDLTRDILIDSCLLLLLFCFIFVLFLLFLMGGGGNDKIYFANKFADVNFFKPRLIRTRRKIDGG